MNGRAGFDRSVDEREQTVGEDVYDVTQPDPPVPLGFTISTAIATIASPRFGLVRGLRSRPLWRVMTRGSLWMCQAGWGVGTQISARRP